MRLTKNMKRMVYNILLILLGLAALISVITFFFMRTEKFGAYPTGQRLERVLASPNWKEGSFKNLEHTPDFSEESTFFGVMWRFFTGKSPRNIPDKPIEHVYTDLHTLSRDENVLVWMGHSSYFLQLDGKRFLVDPVLREYASPLPLGPKAFEGSDIYHPQDIPDIDYLLITHDHWDHLDHPTLKQIHSRCKQIITGLGTGAHLEHWGISSDKIIELDWSDSVALDSGFSIRALPARHFSGRGFKRNQALWVSFALSTPKFHLYLGGDSGFGKHFQERIAPYGPFQLSILECGQYDRDWKYIHMMPEEVAKAAKQIGTQVLLPVHWSKYSLAKHAWDESIERLKPAAAAEGVQLCTPVLGSLVRLDSVLTGNR